jgi:hypothetical protein
MIFGSMLRDSLYPLVIGTVNVSSLDDSNLLYSSGDSNFIELVGDLRTALHLLNTMSISYLFCLSISISFQTYSIEKSLASFFFLGEAMKFVIYL